MRLFLIIVFSFLSIFSFAQNKKKKLTMHEQVELAKKQMAEAEANKYSNEKPFTKLGANIPSFNVLALNEQLFFDTSIAKNKAFVLLLFNPGCDHCMHAAQQFYNEREKLKYATILFVTGNTLWGELPNFLSIAKIDTSKANNIIFAADHSDLTKDIFEYNGIPQVMIYNKEKILQKKYFQNVSIDSVVYYMNK